MSQFQDGPPNLPEGVWMVCCGVWVFIPEDANHTDIALARRMLHRIELDRMQDTSRYDALLAHHHSV